MSGTLPSPSELLELALSDAISPEKFEQNLWALSKGHQRRGRKYTSGDVRIYRTRVWRAPERPKSVTDLSYPPKHLTPLNRANLEGEPVFYASAALPPSFVECRLESGQHVVCSEWRNSMDLMLQEVGLRPAATGGTSDIEHIYNEMFRSTNPSMYKFSARVARHLLGLGDPISGIVYASVASQNSSENIALTTAFVDVGLQFVNASLYEVKNVTDPLKYDVEEIDFALPAHDGGLIWKGRRRQWIVPPGAELKMVSTGLSWDAYDLAGAMVDPE
jgi:RES domain-containing protein